MLCLYRHYCDVTERTEVIETHRCSDFLKLVVDSYSLVREDFPQYSDAQLQTQIRRWATTAFDDVPDCRFTKYTTHICLQCSHAIRNLSIQYFSWGT